MKLNWKNFTKIKKLPIYFLVFYVSISFLNFSFAFIGNSEYVTDEQLKDLAIRKGIIPKNITQDYINKNFQQKNTVVLWFIMERKDKIALIDTLKEMFKEKGVTIKNPSAYYVDNINNVLYKSLLNEDFFVHTKKGIGTIFKTIAIMEGDYDDGSGRSKVEILKDFLGEKLFKWYEKNFPKKVKYLYELED